MNGHDAIFALARTQDGSRGNGRAPSTPLTSLRGKLAATATVGFLLAGLMTGLVLHTTREARQVLEWAQATRDHMRGIPQWSVQERVLVESVEREALAGLALAFGLSVTVFALGAVFNSMAQEISEKQRALEESRAGLERAVAARTAELERANSALHTEHERRRTLFADASHELRMPLTIIRGETQVALRAGPQASQDLTEVFERILVQTRVLTRVFDDLFLIARAEAGGMYLNPCAVDLGELVRGVARDFATIACESGATVHVEASDGLTARVDPDRIRQALTALLDNALRHAGTGVRVRVEAHATAEGVTITVTDNGPGIGSSTAAELFGRFRRGHTRGDGSGLGLTVVRALAEAHGGTASLSNAEQGGTQATLRLPRNTQWGLEPSEIRPAQLMAQSFQADSAARSVARGGWPDVVAAGGG